MTRTDARSAEGHGRIRDHLTSVGLIVAGLVLTATLGAASQSALGAYDPDGRYRGELSDEGGSYGEVGFRVAKNGRVIKGLKTSVLAVCINPNAIGGIEVVEVPVSFARIKVKRNGRFARSETVTAPPPSDAEQVYKLSGRLKSRRATGELVLDKRCSATVSFRAKRRGA